MQVSGAGVDRSGVLLSKGLAAPLPCAKNSDLIVGKGNRTDAAPLERRRADFPACSLHLAEKEPILAGPCTTMGKSDSKTLMAVELIGIEPTTF